MHILRKLSMLVAVVLTTLLSVPQAHASFSVLVPGYGMVSIPDIEITKQPETQTAKEGATVTLRVTARLKDRAYGKNELTYQWYKDGKSISGATKNSYAIKKGTPAANGNYYVVIKNKLTVTYKIILVQTTKEYTTDTKTSATATVVFANPPVIKSISKSQKVNENTSLTLAATVEGKDLKYQWQKNGVDISGASASTYKISAVTEATEGSYRLVVTNTGGSITSSAIAITMIAIQAPTNIAPGSELTLQTSNSSSGSILFLEPASVGTSSAVFVRIKDEITYGTVRWLAGTRKQLNFEFKAEEDDYEETALIKFSLTTADIGTFSYVAIDTIAGRNLAGTFAVKTALLPTSKSILTKILPTTSSVIPEGYTVQISGSRYAGATNSTPVSLTFRKIGSNLTRTASYSSVINTTAVPFNYSRNGNIYSTDAAFNYEFPTQGSQKQDSYLFLMATSATTGIAANYNFVTHEYIVGPYSIAKEITMSYAPTKLAVKKKLIFTEVNKSTPNAFYTVTATNITYSKTSTGTPVPITTNYTKDAGSAASFTTGDTSNINGSFVYKLVWTSSSQGYYVRSEVNGSNLVHGTFTYN